jgi:hypothetical protein
MDTAVRALAVYNGELIAGGYFTTAGGVTCNCIARWSATGGWQPLGSGMDYVVDALTVYNGELIAGGGFTTAGGHPCAFVARWSCTPLIGDMNCDGTIDFGDVNPFVAHLSDFGAWQMTFPGCPPENGDINGDGIYGQGSFGDINPFVELLVGGG